MGNLLFLCHRIPFPPNKGDKIRSFNILKYLANHYSIYLGTFIDDPNDAQYVDELRGYCAEIHTVALNPSVRKFASLRGVLTNSALSVEFYADPTFRHWVTQTATRINPVVTFVYSSTMAQYLDSITTNTLRVIDYVDVDSDKWRAYAEAKAWPLSAIYRREWKLLGQFEREVAAKADHCVFVSPAEADLFKSMIKSPVNNISYVNNGVDLNYFRASDSLSNPYPRGPACVFTGAMDYWANVDAVTWFATQIFPALRQTFNNLEFWIVGSRPAPAVKKLAASAGVHVTGSVPDIRPYLQHAGLAVAPMRIARGVQNKVLEAMAMGCPVVGTSAAFEGLSISPAYDAMIADKPADFRARCAAALTKTLPGDYGAIGRDYVVAAHDWTTNMTKLLTLLGGRA
jgi:polysaccharide biosynthesis protein PslH